MKSIAFFFPSCCFFAQPLMAQNDAAMLAEDCLYIGRKVYLEPENYSAFKLINPY